MAQIMLGNVYLGEKPNTLSAPSAKCVKSPRFCRGVHTRGEADWITSTVALRVIRGDRKGTQSRMRQQDMISSSAGFEPESETAGKAQ
jgi:hypothetical protein